MQLKKNWWIAGCIITRPSHDRDHSSSFHLRAICAQNDQDQYTIQHHRHRSGETSSLVSPTKATSSAPSVHRLVAEIWTSEVDRGFQPTKREWGATGGQLVRREGRMACLHQSRESCAVNWRVWQQHHWNPRGYPPQQETTFHPGSRLQCPRPPPRVFQFEAMDNFESLGCSPGSAGANSPQADTESQWHR